MTYSFHSRRSSELRDRAVADAHFHLAFIEDHADLAVDQLDAETGAHGHHQLVPGGHRKGALRVFRHIEFGAACQKLDLPSRLLHPPIPLVAASRDTCDPPSRPPSCLPPISVS